MTDADELLAVAEAAASAAASALAERFGGPAAAVETKTTPTDLVSEADRAAESAILAVLHERRPQDAVLGEEGGGRSGSSGLRWVVDPLDGTVNFLFGIPQWSVSLACEDGDGAVVGLVLDPLRAEAFAAARGAGATLNGRPLRPSGRRELGTAMVATGFSYDAAVRAEQSQVISRLLPRVRDVRRFGSAALDLAWTAAGRFDAFYERALAPWDRAAGALICETVGLQLRELPARGILPAGLLVAPEALVEELEALVGV